MARELGYENIRFTRIMNLLGLIDDDKEFLTDVSEEEYMRTVENTRKLLVNRYLRPDYNFQQVNRLFRYMVEHHLMLLLGSRR